MNLSALIKLQAAWSTFKSNHPKFPLFIRAVNAHGLQPDTIVEIHIQTPDGKTFDSNLKITESDLDLLQELKQLI